METMKTFKTFSRRSEQRRFRGGFETVSRRFEQRRFQDVLKRSRKKRKEEEEEEEKEEMQTPCAREFGGHGTKNVPGVRGVVEKSRGLFVF
jgi:hypothetical protein